MVGTGMSTLIAVAVFLTAASFAENISVPCGDSHIFSVDSTLGGTHQLTLSNCTNSDIGTLIVVAASGNAALLDTSIIVENSARVAVQISAASTANIENLHVAFNNVVNDASESTSPGSVVVGYSTSQGASTSPTLPSS